MKPSLRLARAFAALTFSAMALAGCHTDPRAAAPEPQPLKLKVYDVPNGSAEQMRSVLSQVFSQGQNTPPLAKVSVAPDGRLLVVAPEPIQEGVEALLKDLGKVAPRTTPTIEMKYWIVLAKPGAGGPIPPELQEIAPALQSVSQAQGGLSFEPLESLALRTRGDEDGTVRGRRVKVWQVASANHGGTVNARLSIDAGELTRLTSKLETNVELKPDQTLVLGEAGIDVRPGDIPGVKLTNPEEPRKLFYVVKPTIIAASKTP